MNRKKTIITGAIIIAAAIFSLTLFFIVDMGAEKRTTEGVTIYDIEPREALSLIKNNHPLILDIRTEKEFNAGHIKMAKNVPLNELPHRLIEIKDFADKKVFVYCRTGRRSNIGAVFLGKNGFKKIYNLKGGIMAWNKAGYKLNKIKNLSEVSVP